jgi:putative hemolysin
LPALADIVAGHLLAFKKLENIYNSLPSSSSPSEFLINVLNGFDISHSIDPEDLNAIPPSGPTVVIANHPFGGLDGIVLAFIICSVRKDVKILTDYLLGRIPELGPLLFMVDPFGGRSSINKNVMALKEAVCWVRNGGLLMVFPAGGSIPFPLENKKN